MSREKNIAKSLLGTEAVRLSVKDPFTFVSGIKSPIYCDNRKMIGFPKERQVVVDAFIEVLKEYKNENELQNNLYKEILKASMIVNNMSFYDNEKIVGGNTTDKCLLSFFKTRKYDSIKKIKTIPIDNIYNQMGLSSNWYLIKKI